MNTLSGILTFTLVSASTALAVQVPVASAGRPEAVIVLGQSGGESAKFAASELQRYLRAISSTEVPIVADNQNAAQSSQSRILIGGPDQNRMVKHALDAGLTGFSDLKPDGFVLKTLTLDNRPAVVAGGNDDAGTMYAVFELARQLGVTFLLTGDILPAQRSSLEIPALDLHMEPSVAQRGFLVEASHHPSVTMLSYQDYARLLDQMAKMKYNDLKLWWFAYSPYLSYSYRGEAKQIGDIATKESGYLNSVYAGVGNHTTDNVTIGKQWFPGKRLAPPELQKVEKPEEAFPIAQDMLRRIIHHARTRNIGIWLVDEISVVPPNLARHGERIGSLPFEGVYGTYMHPLDPVNREIQVNRLRAMIESYPEAAGYLLNFSEIYVPQNNPKHRDFYNQEEPKFLELKLLMAPWADRFHVGRPAMMDSDIGYFDLFKYLLAKRDEINPKAKIGLMTVGRGYVLPLFDKMLPKDVSFLTADSGGRCGYGTPEGVPMRYFGGMGSRVRGLAPYLDDDCDMLGMQFNVGVYTKTDRIFPDGVKYGLNSVEPWTAQLRGTEQNSSFLAEAAWNPQLTLEEFYKNFSESVFGSSAAPDMYRAFLKLEDNQLYLAREAPGFGGDVNPITIGCCGLMSEVRLVYSYSQQPDPFDGPKDTGWTATLMGTPQQVALFESAIIRLGNALESMSAAASKVEPKGKHELSYLMNRTESYRDALRAVVTERKALLAFDHAFRNRNAQSNAQFVTTLQGSLNLFGKAAEEARVATQKYAEIVDHPSDLETLYNLNVEFMGGYDLNRRWMQKIVNFWEGKPYTEHVPFDQVLFPLKEIQVAKKSLTAVE